MEGTKQKKRKNKTGGKEQKNETESQENKKQRLEIPTDNQLKLTKKCKL